MYYIHSVHACLPLVFLSSQLGSLELRMKACTMSLWKQQRGWGPRKTHSGLTSSQQLLTHLYLGTHFTLPFSVVSFNIITIFLFIFLSLSHHKAPQLHSPFSHLFPGSDASHHPSSKQREYSFIITQIYFCLISISGAFVLTVFIMGEQQAAMIQVFKRVIRSAFAAWAKPQPVLQTAPCCFN